MTQRINYGFYFRVVVEDVAATERQKKDCLAGEELFQEGQIQVASRKTLGFEKQTFRKHADMQIYLEAGWSPGGGSVSLKLRLNHINIFAHGLICVMV